MAKSMLKKARTPAQKEATKKWQLAGAARRKRGAAALAAKRAGMAANPGRVQLWREIKQRQKDEIKAYAGSKHTEGKRVAKHLAKMAGKENIQKLKMFKRGIKIKGQSGAVLLFGAGGKFR